MSRPDDAAQVSDALRVLVLDLQRRFRVESEGATALSLAQQSVLARLDRSPGMTGSELARAEHITPQSMSATVASLRDAGLVAATPSPDDARRRVLALTSEGESELATIRTSRSGWLQERLDQRLSPEELGTVAEAVRLLAELAE